MFQIRFNSSVSDEINPLITELVQLRFFCHSSKILIMEKYYFL